MVYLENGYIKNIIRYLAAVQIPLISIRLTFHSRKKNVIFIPPL